MKTKKMLETGGLPHKLVFKVGIKYMLTINVDVEDGLVNRTCGTLTQITFDKDEVIKVVWIEFSNERIGQKLRSKYVNFVKTNDVCTHLVPIEKRSNPVNFKGNYEIWRKQFPLVPAEALTIHKSQGQTYSEICVDLRKTQRMTRCLLYVALSRVRKLSDLYIIGKFTPPKPVGDHDPVFVELK